MFKTFSVLDEKNKERARVMFSGAGADDGFIYGLDLDGVVFYRRPAAAVKDQVSVVEFRRVCDEDER